jgi:hypothetical protein
VGVGPVYNTARRMPGPEGKWGWDFPICILMSLKLTSGLRAVCKMQVDRRDVVSKEIWRSEDLISLISVSGGMRNNVTFPRMMTRHDISIQEVPGGLNHDGHKYQAYTDEVRTTVLRTPLPWYASRL